VAAEDVPHLGRYEILGRIASGGMATVYYGRTRGALGFARTVAIKRIHPHLARDPEFAAMFVDEVRLAARVRHPNLVDTIDVVRSNGEVFLVMEHILGVSLAELMRLALADEEPIPPSIAAAILCGVLYGLHAAHEATDEERRCLNVVHRDVSPQNVLVGVDGTPRLIDFGVARALGRIQISQAGQFKGKVSYAAPEHLCGEDLDRRADIYSAGVVLFELLTGVRPAEKPDPKMGAAAVQRSFERPSRIAKAVPAALDDVVLRAVAREPSRRFGTAAQMAGALDGAIRLSTPQEVARWLATIAGRILEERTRAVTEIERQSSTPEETTGRGPHLAAAHFAQTRTMPPRAAARRRRVWRWSIAPACLVVLAVANAALRSDASEEIAPRQSAGSSSVAQTEPESLPMLRDPEDVSFVTERHAETPSSARPEDAPARVSPRRHETGAQLHRVRKARRAAASARITPSAPQPAPAAETGGTTCKVERSVDADGFVHFTCAR
jgi:serine/threonine-protein kinase